ncbi:tetratricopeptide repeat protein [Roseovarius faecimaris]|uniref:Tetratricopeptide repeat protein n=1 Tax=Roseovarius faecimaris TaxID=2494550 RepID=A0A6I6IPA9_9RHOB|nr:tetratricopeptide repeat protein [Roseovarius faecimaris]QGX98980.1 tetratricopeptide repeat protein [Roseovarius faecimaris]
MRGLFPKLNNIVAALLLTVTFSLPSGMAAAAENARLDELFTRLKEADAGAARRIAAEIELEMSKSGSASMDLLYKRGRDALEAGNIDVAIEHLTALTDHAPDFAQGYYLRAVAYYRAELFGPSFADLERALILNPRHYEAIGLLGYLMEEMNQPELAHDAYLRALELHPHHEDIQMGLDRLGPTMGGEPL